MAAKIRMKQVGTIDQSLFGNKRRFDLQVEEIKAFFNSLHPQKVEVEAVREGKYNKSEPLLGESGECIWPKGAEHPPFVLGLWKVAEALFNLKAKVNDFSMRIYPPSETVNTGRTATIQHVPMEGVLGVASRVVIVVGSNELLGLYSSAAGRTGEGQLLLQDGWGFEIPLGVAAAVDVSFNDNNSAQRPYQKGFRQSIFRKNPKKRWVIVIDGYTNMDNLLAKVEKKAIAEGSDPRAAIKKVAEMSEIDKVVAAASL